MLLGLFDVIAAILAILAVAVVVGSSGGRDGRGVCWGSDLGGGRRVSSAFLCPLCRSGSRGAAVVFPSPSSSRVFEGHADSMYFRSDGR